MLVRERMLKIVKLLQPEMCLDCRFARVADVTDAEGRKRKMIRCFRLDCDNWGKANEPPVTSVKMDDNYILRTS